MFRISLLLRKKLLVYHIHRFFKQVSEKKSLAQRKHAFTFRYRLAEEIDKKVWTGLEPENSTDTENQKGFLRILFTFSFLPAVQIGFDGAFLPNAEIENKK